MVGTTISQRYRIDALLAFGGMGAVYRGEHTLMRKRIAVKLLQSGVKDLPRLAERFRREAMVGAHVTHPHIASASDFGELEDGSYFLVMEYIKGQTLYEVLKGGALSLDRAMGIARQVAAGLVAAHEAGVIHRDIKPHNIMLVEIDGNRTASLPALLLGSDIVKIIDFGFASMAEERLSIAPASLSSFTPDRITQQGEIFGTIAYLAPEAATGMENVDARSDLYALGIVLYQMLTGFHPFKETEPGPLFRCHLTQRPPPFKVRAPLVQVPAAVEAITLKLLEKEPECRYQSALELILAIDEVMGLSGPVRKSEPELERRQVPEPERSTQPSPPPSFPEEIYPPTNNSRGWLWGGLIGAVIAAIIAIFAWNQALLRMIPSTPKQMSASASAEPLPAPVGTPRPAAVVSPVVSSSAATSASNSVIAGKPKEDVTPWKVRLKSSVKVRDWPNAQLAFQRVAELDPEGLADPMFLPTIVDLIVSIGQNQDQNTDQIFHLLEDETGASGLDVLYDVVQRRGGSLAAVRATEILKKPAVLARASVPMRIAFEMRIAPCSKKDALLERAEREGDWRILQVFDSARSACGRSKKFDEVRKKIAVKVP